MNMKDKIIDAVFIVASAILFYCLIWFLAIIEGKA
jgi:hypothetical protein